MYIYILILQAHIQVASPVVAGAVALLASTIPLAERHWRLNPASMKQVLEKKSNKKEAKGI